MFLMESGRQVVDSRSQAPWSLSSIIRFFWGIVEFISFFFRTLFNPAGAEYKRTGSQSSWGRPDDGRGPPGVPRRKMGRINHGGGGPAPPPMSGG
ncbi:selenoprotein K isoform X1 [Stegostoma tigrinum]|uniref:selenoprotein K isoform X1 n=1 Tax=Stegostoma tigrinum TaxID=3053191 RepID=UPI00202B0E2B|nr:selenoprotein K isoform X1 [Stegostoma tigrinum]